MFSSESFIKAYDNLTVWQHFHEFWGLGKLTLPGKQLETFKK